jgi:U-box domain
MVTTQQNVTLQVVPAEYICPITLELMEFPLASKYGHNFERAAIVEWIGSGETCPITRKQLKISDLIHNRALLAEIRSWRQANGIPGFYKLDEAQSDGSDIMHHMYGANIPVKVQVIDHLPQVQEQQTHHASPTSVRTPLLSWPKSPRKISLPIRLKKRASMQTSCTTLYC